MLYSQPVLTGATILAHLIVSMSTMGWPTTGLVWHALTCRITCLEEQMPTRQTQRYSALYLPEPAFGAAMNPTRTQSVLTDLRLQ
jgi:hypothetical protein